MGETYLLARGLQTANIALDSCARCPAGLAVLSRGHRLVNKCERRWRVVRFSASRCHITDNARHVGGGAHCANANVIIHGDEEIIEDILCALE